MQMWTPNNSKDSGGSSKKKHLVHNHSPGKSAKLKESDIFNVKYPKTGIGSNVSIPNKNKYLVAIINVIVPAATCP
jgi:hypothetical protein